MRRLIIIVLTAMALALAAVKWKYGLGEPYPDVSTAPAMKADAIEVVAELDFPPACVAVSDDGRIFFDLHAFGHPKRFQEAVLFEVVDGKPTPYPSAEAQKSLRAPFGLTVDRHNRLWTVESGGLEGLQTRVIAFDLATGQQVIEHLLPEGVGRFAQDLRVTPDGQTVVLADTGLFRFTTPALIAMQAKTGQVIRQFSDHPSLTPQNYYIRRFDGAPHRLAYGFINFQVGVDGLSITPDGRWLYYATMSHGELYRVPLATFLDPAADVASAVERVAAKPQSDGIEVDGSGTVFITDIENSGLMTVDAQGALRTFVRVARVIWADSVALAPNGDVLFTDSAIPAYIQPLATPPPESVLVGERPFRLYRVRRNLPPPETPSEPTP